MPINITRTVISDLIIIEPKVFIDNRGFFFESFNEKDFSDLLGPDISFVQDNHSSSKKGVLRGLHYQTEQPQGKLVRVCKGSIFDVAVDLRQSSLTYGRWFGIELSAENKKQLWVPKGFAHGFLVLSDEAELLYKTSDYWHQASEQSLLWNDSALNIHWPDIGQEPLLNQKDEAALTWSQAPKFD